MILNLKERALLWISKVIPVRIPNGMSASVDVIPAPPVAGVPFGKLKYIQKCRFNPDVSFAVDRTIRNEDGTVSMLLVNLTTGDSVKVDKSFFTDYMINIENQGKT